MLANDRCQLHVDCDCVNYEEAANDAEKNVAPDFWPRETETCCGFWSYTGNMGGMDSEGYQKSGRQNEGAWVLRLGYFAITSKGAMGKETGRV